MSRAKQIKYVVIHTSAGYQDARAIQDYFLRPKSQGGRGWNTGGYHVIIERDGTVKVMYDYEQITNGVRGFNSESIHITYVGGLKRIDGKVIRDNRGKFIAEDTRTESQKISIEQEIMRAFIWLGENGQDIYREVTVLGHRDFSTDQNKDNVIESWERIKECPCFDAIPEYWFYNSLDGKKEVLLPTNK